MKVKYFRDTDTLYIEFQSQEIVGSRDLDENTVMDVDAEGNICAITFEHASSRTDVEQITLEGIAA
jgi:uncharacterized protein YuzE